MDCGRFLLGCTITLLLAALGVGPAVAQERIALFDFELINTSLEPTRPDEERRLAMIGDLLRGQFAERGFQVVDTTPLAARTAKLSLRGCNGCELKLAAEIGAAYAGLGWVQKVSNLILNINLQVRDVANGQLIAAGTVDIRGNTDESWRRGLLYLLERRIFPDGSAPPRQ